MSFHSIKTYGAERGLSCVFRQWDAGTDCQLMHGYSLGFRFTFAAETLDCRGWVLDFGEGGFGAVRRWLHETFDHTFLVAADDPAREKFEALARCGLADIRIVPGTSCERLAQHVFATVQPMVQDATRGRCRLRSVECFEHGANSAVYEHPDAQLQQTVDDVLKAVLERLE